MNKIKLDDVAEEIRSSTKNINSNTPIVGLEHLDPDSLKLSRWDKNVVTTFSKTFEKGDILFGRRRAYLRKAVIAPNDGICSGDITVIRAKENAICKELLPFVIQNRIFFDYANKNSDGSLSPRVKWIHLKEFEFYLPDKKRQGELANILMSLEDMIYKTKCAIESTKNVLNGLFIKSFASCKNTCLISDCCSEIKKGAWGMDPSKNIKKVIKTNNLNYDGTIDFNNITLRDIEDEVFEKNKLAKGDLLIEKCGGTKDHSVGYVCLFDSNEAYVANNFILVLTPNNKVLPYFLFFQMKRMYENGEFDDCYGKTTGIQNLKVSRYLSKNILLPNLEEQTKFCEKAENLIKLICKLEKKIIECQIAERRFLRPIFTGEEE